MIDIVDIKAALRDGQLEAYMEAGCVYIRDAVTGECVRIMEGEG